MCGSPDYIPLSIHCRKLSLYKAGINRILVQRQKSLLESRRTRDPQVVSVSEDEV